MGTPITWWVQANSSRLRKSIMRKPLLAARAACFALLLLVSGLLVAAEDAADAGASFNYIASTLQTFRGSGRLVNNPGIDGADLEYFIALLEEAYQGFSRDFNSESAMCRFYRDPENGRMTIEDRAQLSYSFLRDPIDRLEKINSANVYFKEAVEDQFGRIVLDNINVTKQNSVSYQQLPPSGFDEAAMINFLDAMCS